MGRFLLFWGMQPAARRETLRGLPMMEVFASIVVRRVCFLPVGQKMRREVPETVCRLRAAHFFY